MTSKNQSKESIGYLGIFQVFCHQLLCPTQQHTHIFPTLPFAADVPAELLLVALHIPDQTVLQVDFGLPNTASSRKVSLFLLDHITLLPLLVCFLFMFKF